MSLKIYVGNISYNASEDDLREFFRDCGEVSEAKIISDHHSGRSKGFGFVTFTEKEAADKAVSDKDGAKLDGRPLKVNIAREREQRGGGGGDRGRRGGGGFGGGGNRW